MRSLWLRFVALLAVLSGPASIGSAADETPGPSGKQAPQYVVSCKVFEPDQDPRLIVVSVPEGEETVVPVRLRLKTADGQAELDSLVLNVPGEEGAKSVAIGHRVKVKVDAKSATQTRLDAEAAYCHCDLAGDAADRKLTRASGRYLGALGFGKTAKVVLAADDQGAPVHWLEFIIQPADEEARAAAEIHTVVYSVAGLVSPAKKGRTPELDFDPLIRKIETKIAPESWACVGGEGKMQPFARSASLVVTQTAAVHRELGKYLDRLLDDEDAIQEAIIERQ